MKIFIVSYISLSLFLGCLSTTTMSLEQKNQAVSEYIADGNVSSKDRVHGFVFSGWKPLSDNYLIVTSVYKKDYLIQTKGRCFGLDDTQHIKLNRSSNLSIFIIGDSISPIGGLGAKCYIKAIYPITSAQTDHLVSIGKSTALGTG